MEIRRNTRTLLLVVAVAILACAALTHAAAAADSGASATSAAAAAVEDEVELDVLPDIPSPPAASSSDPTRPPSKNAEPISLNRADFCRACYSVVEEFHKWTVRNFNDPSARRNTTMSRGELVEWFCRTGAFEHWKEPLLWGCIKTVQDHHDEVLAPFLGTHTSHEYTTLGQVFRHRIASCAKIDACDAWVPEARSKSDCESCDRLVKDLAWSLNREQKINATIVEKTLRVICMEVGMRHDRPMEVEAFCHEYVDEHWHDVNKMLVKIYNDPSIPAYDRTAQMKKRFCGGMTEVCDAERREVDEEKRKAKAEEKAARLAAREAKKKAKPTTGGATTAQKEEL